MIKLTEDQRCAMLADYIEGEDVDVLAERYGCSRSYPRQLAARSRMKRKQRKQHKKHIDSQAKDWLRVSTRSHRQRERHTQRDWLYV